jgi:hypothetical protein
MLSRSEPSVDLNEITVIQSYRRALAALVLNALLIALPTVSRSETDRDSLVGLLGVKVVVDVEGDIERPDWSAPVLQRDVEGALRRRGIAVLSETEWSKAPGRPVLRVELTTDAGPAGTYVYSLSIELEQDVRLARDSGRSTPATTWSAPTRVGSFQAKDSAAILEALRKLVEAFTTAYGEVNRKR